MLKHGDTFGVFDLSGDIDVSQDAEQGLYHRGTRFLSRLVLRIATQQPLLLNSTVRQDNSLLLADLTTPDLYRDGRLEIEKGSLHVHRSKLLWRGAHYEQLRLSNFARVAARVSLDFSTAADFADIFEVRGTPRSRRGRQLPVRRSGRSVTYAYQGLDDRLRRTTLRFSMEPREAGAGLWQFDFEVAPGDRQELYLVVACGDGAQDSELTDFGTALAAYQGEVQAVRDASCRVETSNEQFNDWILRSFADLQMLITHTAQGPYPYAGVPWFSTPFGRDGIITALECLWIYPELARGVLSRLAATQADAHDASRDAEPGKIIHEIRDGEMAALGEVPFACYYGSVDATPLFVVLAGHYYRRTGDREFIEHIWPNIERALAWIDDSGDLDGDGFVEYARRSERGLVQQGWKDSFDSVFHADGEPALAPIALCEVQGYVYEALRYAGELAAALGRDQPAQALRARAADLRARFNEAFWCDEIASFGLALDGDKRLCRVRASNAGHALFTGIARGELAPKVANMLLSPAMFSGWGVRTLAAGEQRYNPMSYHNGSVWPHDNALIAMGCARYGLKQHSMSILGGLFDASLFTDLHRLPELFCGFPRQAGQGPTLYPNACSPQAWASAGVFHALQACLGITFTAGKPRINFTLPRLPRFLQSLTLTDLRIGDAVLDLAIRRHPNDVSVNVMRKQGKVDVAVIV
ncbi:MAG TPA: amylo-alpha-1,6-glucosidase [Gammaproteobacteria bacterium]|nr:amylo-alpha-1,6-glucosidase [Gammaproteobacteria bacterium]